MEFSVEKYVSIFVESQFPQFYQEEGPNFILFMKAYYEWMEQQGNPIHEARSLFDYRDIDNTLDSFLEHFQTKYLYGIPFNVIVNKRLLLKHILDVYRSKGSIQCYKLLFKLIYNEDVEVYLPGQDILRPSDGTWVQPKYIEVTNSDLLSNYVGKEVIGFNSQTTAVVENFIRENFNRDIISTVYISNILPRGGTFELGEKIVLKDDISNNEIISSAPTVLGSLNSLKIINGGQNFKVGDVIKIVDKDVITGNVKAFGVNGLVRVSSVGKSIGSIEFDIISGGFGYTSNSQLFVYNGVGDTTGVGASFNIGTFSYTQEIEYNTDIICNYSNLTLNATSFGFPANNSANLTSTIGSAFSYDSDMFGTINSLTNIKTGNSYTQPVDIFVRSVQISKSLSGNISYNTSSSVVTGVGTSFIDIFSNGDVICLKANSSLSSTIKFSVIRTVTNATSITLYGNPSINSTASAQYFAAPVILPSNYATYEPVMFRTDQTINGINENIEGIPSVGNNTITSVGLVNSGKGYVEGELVSAYLYNAISTPIIINGGVNYSNGDLLIFTGGGSTSQANGFVTTNSNGTIVSTSIVFAGSGYDSSPNITVKSANGSGAIFTVQLTEYNLSSEVLGRILKSGIGQGKGYWSTSRGFLNSDKYIQDSYYYQDYSYELRVPLTLNKYKSILYETFHSSGSELFGKYLSINKEQESFEILYEPSAATLS
ncbi:hypothetical protein UFOVP787_118 [uncultured Caudovirales phage]|uniref:Baseplate wedge subunit n=1 Tax=uncultured Caudovirales phage TaxID=2100421 RepID=A0A6J5P5I9_9CAUD|nr:hypothetical protein UFOVP787_118 [uncultured Caudovirales phage]